MRRQNFITREMFLDSSEKQTKACLLSIPAFASNIRLLKENRLNESLCFLYQLPSKEIDFHFEVTVLPLNEKFTRVSVHASYANGQNLPDNHDLDRALGDFESAINAAYKDDISLYKPFELKTPGHKKLIQSVFAFTSALGFIFLKKKWS